MDFPVRVYYEDTDAGGIVYHARYLHFFERARTEYLRNLGFSQESLLRERELAFPVRKIEIDYKISARLDDLLVVETLVQELKGAKIVFKQRLLRQSECLSEAVVICASVDMARMKPVAIPNDIRQAFTA
ncbi:tol-pal system-associated acyl-CoA thioesterase [Pasteurellaceae bacterium LFhippo2]|nr:tol-pal system-associated acyl-CoA thioesterase [Pasteurellaceae bacterium LFhippo2]